MKVMRGLSFSDLELPCRPSWREDLPSLDGLELRFRQGNDIRHPAHEARDGG
jgi:hypothetical protein